MIIKSVLFAGCFLFNTTDIFGQDASKLDSQTETHLRQFREDLEVGRYRSAIDNGRIYLQRIEAIYGAAHDNTTAAMHNLAFALYENGDYLEAKRLQEQCLKLTIEKHGSDDERVASTLNSLGGTYDALGEYEAAMEHYERAYSIQKHLKTDKSALAMTLNNLATTAENSGEFEKAEKAYLKAVAFLDGMQSDSANLAATLNNLGALYRKLENYVSAEKMLLRGLRIREQHLGENHPNLCYSLNSLAVLYSQMGDKERALPLYIRAAKIAEGSLKKDHPLVAQSLKNLGSCYLDLERYKEAQSCLQRALDSVLKAFGPTHSITADTLQKVGRLYFETNNLDEAETIFNKTLKIRLKIHGLEHFATVETMYSLATVHSRKSNFEPAERLLERCWAVSEELYGSDHSKTINSLQHLAAVKIISGNTKGTEQLARRAIRDNRKRLLKLLKYLPESMREPLRTTFHPYSLPCSLSNGPLSAKALVAFKGVVEESIVESRRLAAQVAASGNTQVRELKTQLDGLRQRYIQASVRSEEERSTELAKRIESVERELETHVSMLGRNRSNFDVELIEVQKALSEKDAILDFIKFGRVMEGGRWRPSYGVAIIRSDSEPAFVILESAETLEPLVEEYRRLAGGWEHGDEVDRGLQATLEDLYIKVIQPVMPKLDGVQRLFISPDAQLHFLNFTTLLDEEGRFLAEEFETRYLSSARDIIGVGASHAHRTQESPSALLVGAPSYDDDGPLMAMNSASRGSDESATQVDEFKLSDTLRKAEELGIANLRFGALPGTGHEIAQIGELLKGNGWAITQLTGKQANESELLLSAQSPTVLHIATHGYFLSRDAEESGMATDHFEYGNQKDYGDSFGDPMYRAGLALSGAETTAALWRNGKPSPPISEDGILLAAEVAGLNLYGTRLVVLSACSTAEGETKDGEGVAGLRRGFAFAGAENILMTLWPISDDYTAGLMKNFYHEMLNGKSAPRALHEIQVQALKKLRKEKGLTKAIRLAGAFVMSSHGSN